MKVTVALAAGMIGCLSAAARAEDPMPITSDTPEYCLSLADHVASIGELPPHARALWRVGRGMCQHGDVQHGLARIRRAMMMVRGVTE